MQIVSPIDVEDALRVELGAALEGVAACAWPAPDDIGPGTLCVTSLGGGATEGSPVAHDYDVSVDAWAATPAEAMALAAAAVGVVSTIRHRRASGVGWREGACLLPYPNPDPRRPTLPRATFRATVTARGVPIDID